MQTYELNENVFLHIHQETKFKEVKMRLDLTTPFAKGRRAVRTVLSFLLSNTCKAYPTKDAVQRAADTLYGLELSASDEVRGNAEVLEMACSCINGSLVNEPLLEAEYRFLHDFLLEPDLKDGLFNQDVFEECRKKAATAIRLVDDDPMNHACHCADELYGGVVKDKVLPSAEEAEAVTNEEAVREWKTLIHDARIDLYVLGDATNEECLALARKHFDFEPRKTNVSLLYPSMVNAYQEKQEQRSYSQSFLVQMYHTGLLYTDPLMPAFMLGNGILGALPTSMLFQEVREKRSLCYSIGSDNAVYDGFVRISTQMEAEHLNETKALIAEQIHRLQNMDYTDEDLETARQMYINSWRSSLDSASSLIRDDFNKVMIPGCPDTRTVIEAFRHVSKKDIAQAWKNLRLQACYTAIGEGNDEEAL